MRTDTKITTVYRFEELSGMAQEKAMVALGNVNVDYRWWESVYEEALIVGVRLEFFDLGRGGYCRGTFEVDEWDVAEAILVNHGKDCETYADAYGFLWGLASAEDMAWGEYCQGYDAATEGYFDFDADDDCEDLQKSFRKAIFGDYRIILQREYDRLTSPAAIQEMIAENGFEFTADGEIYG